MTKRNRLSRLEYLKIADFLRGTAENGEIQVSSKELIPALQPLVDTPLSPSVVGQIARELEIKLKGCHGENQEETVSHQLDRMEYKLNEIFNAVKHSPPF